ncbi:hypothetical protein SK128_023345 [Halocaridina rubra]|uniref:Uncharacterized protein n=1 Tax=Halocaridina rubra TaxID=373956 RepID=A0AAN8WB54_HALRR
MSLTKYKRMLMLGTIFGSLVVGYQYRRELIGDLSQEQNELYRHVDKDSNKKIKEAIRETRMEFLNKKS